jgi:hypothetical protein
MRPLLLDYQREPGGFARAGRWLLIASIAAVAATAYAAVSVEERASELQTRVDRLERKRVPVVAKRVTDQEAKRYSEQIGFANSVAERLTLPWDDLLQAIEGGSAEGVAVLALEPDATKRTVRLTAEVKTRSDMLKYVRRLSADSRLREVHLIEYQVLAQIPGSPVRFSLSATWVPSAHA